MFVEKKWGFVEIINLALSKTMSLTAFSITYPSTQVKFQYLRSLALSACIVLFLTVVGCDSPTVADYQELEDSAFDEYQKAGKKSGKSDKSGKSGKSQKSDRSDSDLIQLLAAVSPTGSARYFQMPDSDRLRDIPQDPLNPLSRHKVQLGKLLFHETGLGINSETGSLETFSCASCHMADKGFQAGAAQGVADGGSGFSMRENIHGELSDIQPIRTPSAMNAGFQQLTLWNGQFGGQGNEGLGDGSVDFVQLNQEGFAGLEVQAIKGLQVHRLEGGIEVVSNLKKYDKLFQEVFGRSDDSINRRNAGLAIAAYERTVMANKAPFQKWLSGESSAMSQQEKMGALVFFGKGNCVACHSGPALSSDSFHALGLYDLDLGAPGEMIGAVPNQVRRGRGGFSGNAADDYTFKTPQLYNLADSPFYGHGASLRSIREVVEYKNRAIPQNPSVAGLSQQFYPLNLTTEEVDALVEFLEYGLRDPDLMRYVPSKLPSGNCVSLNDLQSQSDLMCTAGG